MTAATRPPEQALRWAARASGRGARVVSVRRLGGSSTAAVHALTVERRGVTSRLVLRRFVLGDWVAREPDLATREARALEVLGASAIPSPRLVAVDGHGTECGVPAVLMTLVPGRVDLRPANRDAWLAGLARALGVIHEFNPGGARLRDYRRYNDPAKVAVPAWARRPELWERAIDVVRQRPPWHRDRFIHRDFHPGNVLWSRGRVSGIVDWVEACHGPASIDIGHARTNLAFLFGVRAADAFLRACQTNGAAADYHPYWDLVDLVDFLPGPVDLVGSREQGRLDLTPATVHRRLEAYLGSLLARF